LTAEFFRGLNARIYSISFEDANFDVAEESTDLDFDERRPAGNYELDMSSPYHRMIAQRLYQLAMENGDHCWRHATFRRRTYNPFTGEDDVPPDELPNEGVLTVSFIQNQNTFFPSVKPEQLSDFHQMVYDRRRSTGFSSDRLKVRIAKAVSEQFTLRGNQVEALVNKISGTNERIEAAYRFYTNLESTFGSERIFDQLNPIERISLQRTLGSWYTFNSENPTGSYVLNLGTDADRKLAFRLLAQNNQEREEMLHNRRLDVSQHGNRNSRFRNEVLHGKAVVLDNRLELPTKGILSFDYVTARRPSAKESLSDDLFQLFMDEFVTLKTSPSIRDSDRMRRIHESFDTENEGSVSISGLEQMLHAMKEQSVSKKVVLQLLEDFDTDKSGRIDADEFIAMWSRLQILQLESAFKQVDFDRSGTVDASELKRLMVRMKLSNTSHDTES